MKKFKNWSQQHLVASWAIVSGLFALIIHICFSIPAPFDWLEATWSAGDVLTYASTVALGLLAIWQNQKFKEENDKAQVLMDKQNAEAQSRLEKLSAQANEISIITRIFDFEQNYLTQLENASQSFISLCASDKLKLVITEHRTGQSSANDYVTKITNSFSSLSTIINSGPCLRGISKKSMIHANRELFASSTQLLIQYTLTKSFDTKLAVKQSHDFEQAYSARVDYLFVRRNALTTLLLEKKTLNDVHNTYIPFEEDPNEQTET